MQLIRRETINWNLAFFFAGNLANSGSYELFIAAAMRSERPASALPSDGLPLVLGYLHVYGPAGRAAQKGTQVILLCWHGGEKRTSSNRRDRLYTSE